MDSKYDVEYYAERLSNLIRVAKEYVDIETEYDEKTGTHIVTFVDDIGNYATVFV